MRNRATPKCVVLTIKSIIENVTFRLKLRMRTVFSLVYRLSLGPIFAGIYVPKDREDHHRTYLGGSKVGPVMVFSIFRDVNSGESRS